MVIRDGEGFHDKEDDEKLPENMTLITLPPYSPELNSTEKLGDIVKGGICNQDREDLDELKGAITETIRPLRRITSSPLIANETISPCLSYLALTYSVVTMRD